jgi:hypothetical protein
VIYTSIRVNELSGYTVVTQRQEMFCSQLRGVVRVYRPVQLCMVMIWVFFVALLIVADAFCQDNNTNKTTDISGHHFEQRRGIVTDPLAWLNEPLSCDELVDQIKARYLPLGSFSSLPAGKKAELGKILDIMCGAKFEQCKFPCCISNKAPQQHKPQGNVSITQSNIDPADAMSLLLEDSSSLSIKLHEQAKAQAEVRRTEISEVYATRQRERKELIERAVAEERIKKAMWKIFSVPEELESHEDDEAESGDGTPKGQNRDSANNERSSGSKNNSTGQTSASTARPATVAAPRHMTGGKSNRSGTAEGVKPSMKIDPSLPRTNLGQSGGSTKTAPQRMF